MLVLEDETVTWHVVLAAIYSVFLNNIPVSINVLGQQYSALNSVAEPQGCGFKCKYKPALIYLQFIHCLWLH